MGWTNSWLGYPNIASLGRTPSQKDNAMTHNAEPRYVRKNAIIYDHAICLLCGVGYGERRADHACPTSCCLACGTIQCLHNGLARGQCSLCLVGLLDGYSTHRCGYAGCKAQAVAAAPRVRYACHEHATAKGVLAKAAMTRATNLSQWHMLPA